MKGSFDHVAIQLARRERRMVVLRLIGSALAFFIVMLLGLAAGAGAFLGAAMLTDRPEFFLLAGLAALWVVTAGGVAAALRFVSGSDEQRQRRLLASLAAIVLALVAAVTVLRPLGDPNSPLPTVPGQAFWDLPTGSRLAVVHVSAAGTPKPEPVVYLHGGPGVSELSLATPAFGRLAADGFDIYLYDQLGVGRSQRLSDPTGYTVDRDIADLEAIRARIGAQRIILIGHSWGATLAAAYLARYPERVAKVVFSSPGALTLADYATTGTGILDRLSPEQRARANALLYQPRALAAWALARVNPRAAHAFAGDQELDAHYRRIVAASAPGLFCDQRLAATLAPDGEGFYANQVTLTDPNAPDPRAALSRSDVPALVLKAGCDYLPWPLAIAYRDIVPNAAMVYLPDAGHQAYLEQPATYFATVRAFLLGEPLPVPTYDAVQPPPDYQGAR
jgi:proline iminopeptidase